MEPILLSELKPGADFAGLLLVVNASVRVAKTGSDYLDLQLRDPTGVVVRGYKFDAAKGSGPASGDVVAVKGSARPYNGSLSLRLADVKVVPEADASRFLPRGRGNPEELRCQLQEYLDQVAQPQLALLLKRCFAEPFLERFCQAPASVLYHQAVAGGLLEHTVAVARICLDVLPRYPTLDRDLLLCGALLHDIGKVEEITLTPAIGHTSSGKSLGHIVLGLLYVSGHAESLPDLSAGLREKLYHLIVSHHGSKEFGSPIVPNSLEAVALYHADLMDCKLAGFLDVVERSRPTDEWTPWSKMFQSELRVPDDLDKLLDR